jgi:hypothetical protein
LHKILLYIYFRANQEPLENKKCNWAKNLIIAAERTFSVQYDNIQIARKYETFPSLGLHRKSRWNFTQQI